MKKQLQNKIATAKMICENIGIEFDENKMMSAIQISVKMPGNFSDNFRAIIA